MHVLAVAAATDHEIWKNWAYVGVGTAFALVGGIWDWVAKHFTPAKERKDYETGCLPLIFLVAGAVMVATHIFSLRF